ncbi:MAG: gamma carbonic anhydrase family protein [Phycisphaeraceae bacterium]|nr:MAG: gamma carbonic anhydrase family protein [Phycisphaeraceae bacterium]
MRELDGAYIADTARVIGDVRLGRHVNIWYGAAIRGDVAPVILGEGSNVQDNAVVHCDHRYANVIGRNVVIGHGAIVHGEAVGDGTLIGMGAIVLGHTKIGKGCLVAAGAVVPPGLEVPDGMVVMGVPGKIVRKTTEADRAYMAKLPGHYVALAQRHVAEPGSPMIFEIGEILNAGLMK